MRRKKLKAHVDRRGQVLSEHDDAKARGLLLVVFILVIIAYGISQRQSRQSRRFLQQLTAFTNERASGAPEPLLDGNIRREQESRRDLPATTVQTVKTINAVPQRSSGSTPEIVAPPARPESGEDWSR